MSGSSSFQPSSGKYHEEDENRQPGPVDPSSLLTTREKDVVKDYVANLTDSKLQDKSTISDGEVHWIIKHHKNLNKLMIPGRQGTVVIGSVKSAIRARLNKETWPVEADEPPLNTQKPESQTDRSQCWQDTELTGPLSEVGPPNHSKNLSAENKAAIWSFATGFSPRNASDNADMTDADLRSLAEKDEALTQMMETRAPGEVVERARVALRAHACGQRWWELPAEQNINQTAAEQYWQNNASAGPSTGAGHTNDNTEAQHYWPSLTGPDFGAESILPSIEQDQVWQHDAPARPACESGQTDDSMNEDDRQRESTEPVAPESVLNYEETASRTAVADTIDEYIGGLTAGARSSFRANLLNGSVEEVRTIFKDKDMVVNDHTIKTAKSILDQYPH